MRACGSESALQITLETLLAGQGKTIVAALGEDGWRVALPESVRLGHHHPLPVPNERTSFLEVIVAADRVAAVAAWEQMQRDGVAVTSVHAVSDPVTPLTLTLLDTRREYGVTLAVLSSPEPEECPGVLARPILVPARPRQARMHKSLTAVITEIDANVTAMLGWAPEQMVGQRSSAFIHPEDQERAVTTWMLLTSTLTSQRVRLRHKCADDSWLWVEVENIHNGAERSDDVDVVAHVSDISDEMAAHEALRRREQQFSRLAECLPTGVLQLRPDGSVAYANARLTAILHGRTPTSISETLNAVARRDRRAVQAAVRRAMQQGVDRELEVGIPDPSGRSRRCCALTVVAVPDQEGQRGALLCVNDVTKSARLREELRLQAMHDPLTGCLNRAAVVQALERLLSEQQELGFVVVFVDIDDFKAINDRLGHAAGDAVLVQFARRLQKLTRRHDLVARLGGDEFLLVCRSKALPSTPLIAERIHRALEDPFALPSGRVKLHASIGVGRPGPKTTVDALIDGADTAMYRAKQSRERQPACFTDSTHTAVTV